MSTSISRIFICTRCSKINHLKKYTHAYRQENDLLTVDIVTNILSIAVHIHSMKDYTQAKGHMLVLHVQKHSFKE